MAAPKELSQIGGHGYQFHEDPHTQNYGPWKVVAALFRKVKARCDPEFGGERLDQHRHQIAGYDDP